MTIVTGTCSPPGEAAPPGSRCCAHRGWVRGRLVRRAVECGVAAVVITGVQEVGERGDALDLGAVGAGVGPTPAS